MAERKRVLASVDRRSLSLKSRSRSTVAWRDDSWMWEMMPTHMIIVHVAVSRSVASIDSGATGGNTYTLHGYSNTPDVHPYTTHT